MKCPLCGYEFSQGATPLCQRCPLNKNCDLVCCPHCGYQWPQTSRLVSWLQRLFKRKEVAEPVSASSRPDPTGYINETAEETKVVGMRPSLRSRLSAQLREALDHWVLPIFRPRPLGPILTPEVIRAFELHRQRLDELNETGLGSTAPPSERLAVHRLSDLRIGDRAEVLSVTPDSESRLHRLSSLGVVPGTFIELHQKRPSFVVKVDETLLAIDRDVASRIFVVVEKEVGRDLEPV